MRPTEKGVKDLRQALVSEFEQIAYRGSTASSSKVPFVKAVTTSSGPPPAKASSDGGSPSSPTKAKGKASCKYFLSDQGCSKGKACTWSHAFTRKDKQGRCWPCGSTQHQQGTCVQVVSSAPRYLRRFRWLAPQLLQVFRPLQRLPGLQAQRQPRTCQRLKSSSFSRKLMRC